MPRLLSSHLAAVRTLVSVAVMGSLMPWSVSSVGAHAAQEAGPPAVILVVDTSGSMSEDDANGTVKIEGARASLLNFLDSAPADLRMGLRTYPDPGGSSCGSGVLQFPVDVRDPGGMAAQIRTLVPDGDTPTAEALRAAADDLRAAGATAGSVVLVSDGGSTCEDPCVAAADIATSGIDIQVYAVGLAVGPDAQEELQCIADATDGAYVDAADTAEVDEILSEFTAAELAVNLAYEDRVVAEVGDAGAGFVDIRLTVDSVGAVAAQDLTARIRFDEHQAAVIGPVRLLGNLEPEVRRTTSWRFRPELQLAGRTVEFTVTVTGPNIDAPIRESGSIEVVDVGSSDDAGAVLAEADKIVILGDSYSSGEGAGSYLAATDTFHNRCHRSPLTYLAEEFSIPSDLILACSGATTADFWRANEGNGVEPQLAQLSTAVSNYPGQIDGAVLTLGGNDLGFETIIDACLTGYRSCTNRIGGKSPHEFLSDQAGCVSETGQCRLVDDLAAIYRSIDAVLNKPDELERRGHRAPVLVLPYVRILPGAKLRCSRLLASINQAEFDLASEIVTTMNGYVEAAAEVAASQGAAVAFVPNTEDAFLPNHTICAGPEAWVRAPNTADFDLGAGDLLTVGEMAAQELFHPNDRGYVGETSAIIRWSQTVAADAVTFSAVAPGGVDRRLVSLEELAAAPTIVLTSATTESHQLSPGGVYRVSGAGFAPNTVVRVEIRSARNLLTQTTADDEGHVEVGVVIPPDLPTGDHALSLIGENNKGELTELTMPVDVQRVRSPPWPLIIVAAGLVFLAAGLGLRRTFGNRLAVEANDPGPDPGNEGDS